MTARDRQRYKECERERETKREREMFYLMTYIAKIIVLVHE